MRAALERYRFLLTIGYGLSMLALVGLNFYGLALPVYLLGRSYGVFGEPFWCGNSVTEPLLYNLEVLVPIAFGLLVGGGVHALRHKSLGLFWPVSGVMYLVALVINLVFGAWYHSYLLELGAVFFFKQIWWF